MKLQKQSWTISIFAILHCGLSISATAQSSVTSSPNRIVSITSSVCLTSPFDCLEKIDQILATISPKSRVYYEVLQYKFEALFNLQRVDELYSETKQWIDNSDLPLPFQVTNAIYFAKTAWWKGNKSESRSSYLFAKSLLAQMNDQYPSPMRLVQFANLQMQQQEYEEAYKLLSQLAQKYPNNPNYHLMTEIHGNLAHAANQMGNTKQALQHWLDTEKWVKLFGNKQQMAVSAFNLADVYEQLGQLEKANMTFARSISIAIEAGDIAKANQARFHLSHVMIKQKQYCQARDVSQQIEELHLPRKLTYNLNALKKATQAC